MSSIYSRIEEKGKKEAQEILEAGAIKASELEASILEGFEKEYKKIIDETARVNADYLKTKVTQVEQLAKQKALQEKRLIIEKVKEKVHEQLLKINDQELFDLVVKTISLDSINGDEVIKVSTKDYQRYLKLFSTESEGSIIVTDILNQKLGSKYHLTLSKEPADIEGGFILVGKVYDVDHSYKVLLENLMEANESEIAKMLFEKE